MSERGEYCYGKYKGTHRFAMDQVPGQVNVSNQTLNDIGTGECFLTGAKRDMRGRQCTYQVCVCAEGEQFVLPVLIFRTKLPLRIDGVQNLALKTENVLSGVKRNAKKIFITRKY